MAAAQSMARNGTAEKQELSPKQHCAAAILAATGDIQSAVEVSGASERSIRRWQGQAAFQDALRTAQREALRSAAGKLAAACDTAVDRLVAEMGAEDSTPQSRIRAALGILEQALRMAEAVDIQERLEAIEAALEAQGGASCR